MGCPGDRKRTIQQIEPEAAMERGCRVVVATGEAIERIPKRRVHPGIDACINIDNRVQVRRRHDARVLEWDAEIENVGVRVQQIIWRVDHLRSLQGHVLTYLDVHPPDVSHGR